MNLSSHDEVALSSLRQAADARVLANADAGVPATASLTLTLTRLRKKPRFHAKTAQLQTHENLPWVLTEWH